MRHDPSLIHLRCHHSCLHLARVLLIVFSLISPFCAFLTQPAVGADPPPTIRKISISGNTRTVDATIERELLFVSGEPLNSAIVAETSRNLRRLFFLGNVEIRIQREGRYADITVLVQDLYARALTPSISGEVGELSYGLIAMDYNFLGRGQIVQLTLGHDAISGNWGEAYLQVPRVSGSRKRLTANLNVSEEGHDIWGTVSRPFYALSVAASYGFTAYTREEIRRQYNRQTLARKYTDRLRGGSLWYTRSYGERVKVRPNLRLAISNRQFSPATGFTYAPSGRQRVLPSIGLTVWRPRYVKSRYVQDLGRMEYLQIGSRVAARVGLSYKGLGSDQTFSFYQVEIVPRFEVQPGTYVFSSLSLSSRWTGGQYTNLVASSSLRAYAKVGETHSLAFRLRWDALSRPEDSSQFLLGSLRGLRGYAIRRFDGTRRVYANVEARPTLHRHELLVLAGAVFFDAGSAWTPSRTSPELNLAAGVGARISLTRVYNTPVFRADVAYGIQDRTWQLTVGMGQYF